MIEYSPSIIDSIIEKKQINGQIHYLVIWKGLPFTHRSWVPPIYINFELEQAYKKKSMATQVETKVYSKKFEVQKIVDSKVQPDGKTKYLVKWVGYKSSSNTWQPSEHLSKWLITDYNNSLRKQKLTSNNLSNQQPKNQSKQQQLQKHMIQQKEPQRMDIQPCFTKVNQNKQQRQQIQNQNQFIQKIKKKMAEIVNVNNFRIIDQQPQVIPAQKSKSKSRENKNNKSEDKISIQNSESQLRKLPLRGQQQPNKQKLPTAGAIRQSIVRIPVEKNNRIQEEEQLKELQVFRRNP